MLALILIILFIILLFAIIIIIWFSRRKNIKQNDQIQQNQYRNRIDKLSKEMVLLQQENEYLQKALVADNNIFHYIRCINIPQTPSCTTKGNSHICRSRLMDCNKIKLVLENDPIAVERIKVATNRFREAGEPKNPSELTEPIKSWWFF